MLIMAEKKTIQKSPTASREEEVLAVWKENGIFEKSLTQEAPQGEFVFYDGPPFATGLPHYGSLLSSVVKDVVGRYKTMRGYRVPRRWGWDCHGLPIEHMIEKKLELKTKKDIESMGIDRFNEEARKTVLAYADEWKEYVERIGRWVDFDNSYKTMDNTYIESVWWALKKIHEDKRLYEGKKVLMYCPRCETPLSKAEIAMDNSYKDITEEAVYVKFKVTPNTVRGTGDGAKKFGDNVYLLAWTTTPWTLPGNVALAVGVDSTYCEYKNKDTKESYIIAEERVVAVLGDDWKDKYEVVEGTRFAGSHFARLGISYEPLYEVKKAIDAKSEKAWTVQVADFVTTEEGTGIVHTAPMYGEDDYQFGIEHTLPIIPILDATGTYNADAPELVRGMYHKKGGKIVVKDLEERGLLFKAHNHTHSYPHCYRCGTALIYNALSSWFIDIQSVKERMLEANEEVNWYPNHLKHGRFKNIVETAPDWTISRNRFWASPLPIWKHEITGAVTVIGSLEELRKRVRKSGNTYLFIRHGEAESNTQHVISSLPENEHHVTDEGKAQIDEAIAELKKSGITKIITSPLLRTRETASRIATALGIKEDAIVIEERFKEWQLGELNNKSVRELTTRCPTYEERFTKGCGTGETLVEMKRRVGDGLYELETTYKDETILVVGHEYTVWLAECVAKGATVKECIEVRGTEDDFVKNGEIRTIDFAPIPHNAEYELDLHRPYIDDLELFAEDGARLVRVPEVVDCWVESGSMPFASEHYPHENKESVERRYPGDFIAEYIAQTRTWFYYMHAMGVLLFDAPSFKNCVTTGTLLASDGAKISKSKLNFTDPRENIDTYGADAMRFYMLGSVVMSAEDSAFKDEELRDVHNRFINMFWNSYKFYEMYATANTEAGVKSTHVLDRWILARLYEVVREVTEYLDAYDTVRTARSLRDFVTDLSQWYIRRSRDRFKSEQHEDREQALATASYVFITFAKVLAPIAPFIGESVYKGAGGEKESVHLEAWPTLEDCGDDALIEGMAEVRRIASLALEKRQGAGIKVRQPLASISLTKDTLSEHSELIEILLDEINVKEYTIDATQKEEVVLDCEITDALKKEGLVREVVRSVQDARKKGDFSPHEMVVLVVSSTEEGNHMFEEAEKELRTIAGVETILYEEVEEGMVCTLDGVQCKIALKRN